MAACKKFEHSGMIFFPGNVPECTDSDHFQVLYKAHNVENHLSNCTKREY